MSLVIRRKAGSSAENEITISAQRAISPSERVLMLIRVIKVDPDGTVHLAINGDRRLKVVRSELIETGD